MTDRTPRIIRANGKVEPLTKPLSLSAFAQALRCDVFGVIALPGLGEPPMVMVCDAQALPRLLGVNDLATRIFLSNTAGLGNVRGDVAIVRDGSYGGFYPEQP